MAAKPDKPEATTTRAGRCVVYDKAGREIWHQEHFVCGVDTVPRRLSMVMGAMLVVSKDGERVARWNPWGVL